MVTIHDDLRVFGQKDLVAAYAHSASGGIALHLMDGSYALMQARTPNCFKNRGQIAHLFDQNRERLVATAKRLGVRVILVERQGTPKQHIDLCGKPLERAREAAQRQTIEHEQDLFSSAAPVSPLQWIEYPTHAGRWLVNCADEASPNRYEADVREICAGVFEALIHGYCLEFNPVCCLPHGFTWCEMK